MADLTLCCFPGACSRATMVALEETGVPYAIRVVNLRTNSQKAPDYLALNPKGKVPTLINDGKPLTENVAILEYLAKTHPDAGLLPSIDEALLRAEALSAVAWLSSTVLPLGGRILRPERICDLEGSASRIAAMAGDEFKANLQLADRHIAGRTWWIDRWSVADAYLFYIVGLAKARGVDALPYSALMAHTERMKARPATQRVLAWEEQTVAQLQAA
jgi:glutathione S-transferase